MPQCYRCERMLPTAEVRRTSKGWLCKDNGVRDRVMTRCERIRRELAQAARAARKAAA